MKKKKIYTVILIFLVTLLVVAFVVFTYCPSLYISKAHIKEVESQISNIIPGLEVNLNANNAVIKHSSGYFHKTRAKVMLKDVNGVLNLAKSTGGIGKFKINKYIPEGNIIITIPDLILELGILNKFVSIRNMNNLYIQPEKNKELFSFKIKNLQAKNYNLYNTIQDEENHKSKPNSKIFNIKVTNLSGQYKDKKLSVSELTIDRNMSRKIYKYLLDKDDKNIAEILKSGKEEYTFTVELNKAALHTDNLTLDNDKMALSLMFIPNNNRYSVNANFQGSDTKINGSKKIYGVLNNIKNTKLSINIDDLTSNLIGSISKLADKKDKSIGITTKIRDVMLNIKQYQPKINIDCAFNQRLIDATANGTLIFTGLSFIPTGAINIEITGINKMEKELEDKELMNDKVQKNLDTLQKYEKTTIEVRSQMPFIFINDRAITDLFREWRLTHTLK